MARIHRLDPALVNQIAAGEVIERPASVVKELLENAIDAGSTRIDVALEEGGLRLIRVTDNGGGIAREDLPLAIAPHATSKLQSADDLFRIGTLGFRGEALASIASVSRMTIRSRTLGSEAGYELGDSHQPSAVSHQPIPDSQGVPAERVSQIDGDSHPVLSNPNSKIQIPKSPPFATDRNLPIPVAAPPGTTIEVRNLFYNVPARRKFLKQPPVELSNVTEQLARLALAHPGVAFTLTHNGRTARDLPATTDRRTRIADFYGADLAECLIPIERDERGLAVSALIAPPAQSRATSKWQYVFLNGRYIVDKRIAYAVREAYRGLVEAGRYPVVFIFLDTAPDQFDVNVHPTKIEVRWRDAGLVQSQVLAAIRETLLAHDLTPGLATQGRFGGGAPGRYPMTQTGGSNDPEERSGVRRAIADYLKSIDPTQARLRFAPPRFDSPQVRPTLASDYAVTLPPSDRTAPREIDDPAASRETNEPSDHDARLGPTIPTGGPGSSTEPTESLQPYPDAGLDSTADGTATDDAVRALGAHLGGPESQLPPAIQIHNTYLVAQTAEGVVIIDQHALHERILYERFRRRILAGPLESQRLLLPETISVSPGQAQAAEEQAELLGRLGLELSAFGPRSLGVQAFPSLLANVDIRTFVGDLLDRLAEAGQVESPETLLHAALDMMACKAAVKAGDPLTTDEIHALLAQRHLVEKSSNCPHGRPTTLQLSTRDLEKQFKRI